MKRVIVLGFAVLIMLALVGPAAAQYKATMKLASTQSMDHPYMVGAQKFADLIKERSNGRIEIKLYPSNQLGKGEREMCEGIQQGAIDLLVTSTGPLGGFSPSINILDFPFLFRDFAHVDLVMDGPIGRKLLDDFEKANIKALAFWENGFRHLTNCQASGQEGRGRQGTQDPHHGKQGASGGVEECGAQPHPHGLGRGLHGLAAKCHRRPGKPDRRLLTAPSCGTRGRRTSLLPLTCTPRPPTS